MIGRLKGTIIEKQPPYLLLDVQGVGYELQLSMTSFYPLGAQGSETIIHTHLAVSETSQQLYGFYTQSERQLFRTLIKVSGVGPKMALGILSGMSADEFVQCVSSDNVTALVKIPGVGKKTAERLIIEVKDKLKGWQGQLTQATPLAEDSSTQIMSAVVADAESALVALGYKPTDASKAIARVQKEEQASTSEEMIRLALKGLSR